MYVPDYVYTVFVGIISHVDQSKGYGTQYITFIKKNGTCLFLILSILPYS